jgi:hypothetical protein
MDSQDNGVVAALQLLAGDMSDDDLYYTIRAAFGDRLNIIWPGMSGSVLQIANGAASILKDVQAELLHPPLGRLVCERLEGSVQNALSKLLAINTLLAHSPQKVTP